MASYSVRRRSPEENLWKKIMFWAWPFSKRSPSFGNEDSILDIRANGQFHSPFSEQRKHLEYHVPAMPPGDWMTTLQVGNTSIRFFSPVPVTASDLSRG